MYTFFSRGQSLTSRRPRIAACCNYLTRFLLRFRISLTFKIHLIQLLNQVLLQCLVCTLLMQLQALQVKKNLCQIIKINYKKLNLSVYESCSLQSQRENPNSCGSVSEINLYYCSKSIQNHASSLYQFNSTFEMNHKENL